VVEVTVEGEDVVFRPVGSNRRLAFRKGVRVARAHVRGVRHEPPPRWKFRGVANKGSWIPWVHTIGSYKVGRERIFFDVRHRHSDKVLVVELADEHFDRLAVEVQDPAAVLQLLRDSGA